jgi:hypothetical protein
VDSVHALPLRFVAGVSAGCQSRCSSPTVREALGSVLTPSLTVGLLHRPDWLSVLDKSECRA